MFLRRDLDYLVDWKGRRNRKPLIVRGARQVGKSVLVRMLGEKKFDSIVEVNFESDPAIAELFASRNPATILSLLEVRMGTAIRPGRTLLFLDEVQAAPEVVATLRFFHERMPDLHVIAAGSLLDIALREPSFSVPVGRIEYLHLGPVTFEEFLSAVDEDKARAFLVEWRPENAVPASIHGRLLDLVRAYVVSGGMPRAVAAYAESRGFREADMEKQSILAAFRDDFGKYGPRVNVSRVRKVYDALPRLVGKRFKYSHVDREERSKDLSRALDLLCMARVAHRVIHTAANGVPLSGEADERRVKVLHLDVGLVLASTGLSILDMAGARDLTLVNEGAVAEQLVGQHLLYAAEPYRSPSLHFWAREARNSAAEVDYVVAEGPEIVPVEVKAGKTGTLRSLHVFMGEKRRPLAVRFNSEPPSLAACETPAGGPAHRFRLLSLPFYLVGQASRLIREILGRA